MRRVGALGFLVFKLAVTGLFVYIANRSLHETDLSLVLGRMRMSSVVVVVILGLLGVIIHTHRWRLVLRARETDVSFGAALKTFLWGNALAFVTPARIGELARGLELTEEKASTALSVAVDKVFVVGATLLFGSVATVLYFSDAGALGGIQRFFPPIQFVSAGLFLLLFSFHPAGIRGRLFPFARRLVKWWHAFPGIHCATGRQVFLWSMMAHLVLIVQTAIALDMFGNAGFLPGIKTATLAYSFMVFFPFSIANMGVREYAFSLFLSGSSSISSSEVAAICLGASGAIMLVNMLLPAVAGVLWELIDGRWN